MSSSAFDHPFLSGLLGDEEVANYFSAEADIRAMLTFEAALAGSEAEHGIVPVGAAARIADICGVFEADIARLRAATARDGVVVPDLVKQLRVAVGGDDAAHVHVGATSQDVIDTSLMIRLKAIAAIFTNRLSLLIAELDALDGRFGRRRLMGHTRMQAAIPITVSDRLYSWRAPLAGYRDRWAGMVFPLQLGGAAGTLDTLQGDAALVRRSLAEALGLAEVPQWQSQRGAIADLANLMSLVTGHLGKIGQDVALLALSGEEITIAGGGTSSAMVHKQNPVAAEVLVSLARFNATQVSGMHQALVHEQERSGAAWTLEWLLLPPMTVATGAALNLATKLMKNIISLGNPH